MTSIKFKMNRRLALAASAAAASIFVAVPAWSQSHWPDKTVKIVVPFAAGGTTDILARAIAPELSKAFGQQFIVDNRSGAGGNVGADIVAKSAPDGYTLLMMSNTHTVNETLLPNKPFKLMSDFVGIAPVNASDLMLVVNPKVPARTLPELIALAKKEPGKLNYASSGTGTPYHMAGELFKHMAGVNIVHVPYKGSSAARSDVLGGQVDMMFDAVTTMAPMAREGKVRALATTGAKRDGDLPTVAETVPGYEALIWLGLMAPKGTPDAIVQKLNAAVQRIVTAPETRKLWAQQGAEPMAMGTAEFDKYLQQDIKKWAEIVKISGAKPE